MKFLIVAAFVALASAEAPINSYGVPSAHYGVPPQSLPSNNHGVPGASYSGIPSQPYGAGLGYGRSSGINHGPYEFQPNLELENEGANIPNDVVGQDILERVIYALNQDSAQQAAARATSQSSASGAPVYGPPSGQDGARDPPAAVPFAGPLGSFNTGGQAMLDLFNPFE